MLKITKAIAMATIISSIEAYCGADQTPTNNGKQRHAENLTPNADFQNDFKGYFRSSKEAFSLIKIGAQNILVIKQNPNKEKNKHVKCSIVIELPPEKVTGKKFRFGVTLKVKKISGAAYLAIREIDSNGESLTYRKIKIKKRDAYNWKKFTKTFTTSSKTVKLAFYIVAKYLGDEDEIQVKEIFLERI
jgi:hypothetical protein